MGMAKASSAKSKKNGEKSTPFNVNASLARLEKKYDTLIKAHSKTLQKSDDDDDDKADSSSTIAGSEEIVTTEYVVATRAEGFVADWVPIAQFCVARSADQASVSEGSADPMLHAAISCYCRELGHVATIGARVFQSVPRNLLQYAVEPLDSFHKHVYEPAIEGKNEDANNVNVMTKQEAREVLNLANGAGDDKSEIKQLYRKLSFEWHPDRFVGMERSETETAEAAERYARIKLAYDTLNSGVRDQGKSWYQSLGGKARTDFIGPLHLLPMESAKSLLDASRVETALCGMNTKIVQGFVTRSQQQ
jgi:DnaJ domain